MGVKGHSSWELFKRYEGNPILTPGQWPYRVNSVFNAAAAKVGDEVVLLARVETHTGISHLATARSRNGVDGWVISEQPALAPDPGPHPEEVWGIEDPRATYVEEIKSWVVLFTAYSRGGPMVSMALTQDFESFERLGPVMPPEDKDAALFPVRFQNRWAMLHRPVPAFPGVGAHIWISFSPDLKHWGDHQILLRARKGGWWDADKIGLSPPPLRTKEGWLVLYHGVRKTASGSLYRLGLALLDLEDPRQVIRRSEEWVFGPKDHYERHGDVDNVVFPCGWIVEGDELKLYYGGADACIALATTRVSLLLEWLREHSTRSVRIEASSNNLSFA